jgi:hypothetical protein
VPLACTRLQPWQGAIQSLVAGWGSGSWARHKA